MMVAQIPPWSLLDSTQGAVYGPRAVVVVLDASASGQAGNLDESGAGLRWRRTLK
jgi:hypothetical protein